MLAPASEVTSSAGQALLVRNYSAGEPVSLRDASTLRAGASRLRAVARRHPRPGRRRHACIRLVSRGGHDHGEASAAVLAAQARKPFEGSRAVWGEAGRIRPARGLLDLSGRTDDGERRHQRDLEAEPEAPVLDVVVVPFDPVGEGRLAAQAVIPALTRWRSL